MSGPGAIDAGATLRRPLAELADPLPLAPLPPGGAFQCSITPPGSKSITNRALLLAALADGVSTLRRPLLDADDSLVMIRALRALGAVVDNRDRAAITVRGLGGRLRASAAGGTLHLGNAGTATRFLAAAALLGESPIVIDGDTRMRQRPIGDLVDALRSLGAVVEFLGRAECPPIRIHPPPGGLTAPADLRFGTTASGQFISALLLVSPWLRRPLRIRIDGEPTSPPYILMTLRLLERLGARHLHASDDLRRIETHPDPLPGFSLDIEPDASGATFFWSAAAMCPGSRCVVPGLSRASLQGDVEALDVLGRMGAKVSLDRDGGACAGPEKGLSGVEADLSRIPDAAMALAVAACFAGSPSRFTGLRTLRVKETDRLSALQKELSKLGADVATTAEAISIVPARSAPGGPIVFETYNDHRMAMSLALVALRRPGVSIRDPGCVAKTYPTFWADLGRLYGAARS